MVALTEQTGGRQNLYVIGARGGAKTLLDSAPVPYWGGAPALRLPSLASPTWTPDGDAIAYIVADDLNSAKSAAELIEVDYDPLPAVVDTAAALSPGAALVWPERGSNLAYEIDFGDAAGTDAAFASAAQVAKITIVNSRLICNYMEPRAIVAEYDAANDHYTVTVGSQGVHGREFQPPEAKRRGGLEHADEDPHRTALLVLLVSR